MKAEQNPFRSSELAKLRYRMDRELSDTLLSRIRSDCWHSTLVGPHGTGKTTLLEDLAHQLGEVGYALHWARLHLQSTAPERKECLSHLEQLNAESICLFDGAEVLNTWQWYQVLRRARKNGFGLIATLHRRRRLPILFQTKPDFAMMRQLVHQLSGDERLESLAHKAFKQNNGNMREVFRACYWACARE